jgi:putative hydrolase of the HAD superfamily
MISALILDLDNTIYPVKSVADKLFVPIFSLLDDHAEEIGEDKLSEIKTLLMKKAWQKIAEQYKFSNELTEQGTKLLRETTCDFEMKAYDDYALVRDLKMDKFLVTMGFTKMQQSKVERLNLKDDFKEVLVNDPEKTQDTKKEVFESLLKKYNYQPQQVLVIGDDPDSEIKAARDLGIPTVLYDVNDEYSTATASHHIKNYSELKAVLESYE